MYVCRYNLRPENICFWGARSLRSLAHISYNCFGLPPPPPHTKKLATLLTIPTEVITGCCFLLPCQLVPPENEDPFEVRLFLLRGGGGGGLSAQNCSAPLWKPKAPPPVPPLLKIILAMPLSPASWKNHSLPWSTFWVVAGPGEIPPTESGNGKRGSNVMYWTFSLSNSVTVYSQIML